MKAILLFMLFYFPAVVFGQGTTRDSLQLEKIKGEIKNGMFDSGYTPKNIPGFIRHAIKTVDREKFKLAGKGERWSAGDAGPGGSLPRKRMVYIAYNKNLYVITYEQGGIGRTFYSRIIEYEKKNIKCITTLLMPPHRDLEDLKRIMERKELFKYVAAKSICY